MPNGESQPEMVRVLAKTKEKNATLSIVADGQHRFYALDLKQVLTLIESAAEAVRKMTA